MAEAVAAVGLMASIASLVDIGCKVVSRIRELQESTSNAPAVFEDISVQLPVLLDIIQKIQALDTSQSSPSPNSQQSLDLSIRGCARQISEIDKLSQKYSKPAKSSVKQVYKAIGSFNAEKKLMEKLRILETYKTTLHMYLTNSTIHQSTHQTEIKVLYDFPYAQISNFVGRQSILDELSEYLEKDKQPTEDRRIAILHGMGGQGKTQIALEYCRRAQIAGAFAFICWIDASSEKSLIRSYAAIAEKLGGRKVAFPDDQTRVSHFREYFGKSSDRWILLFDNFDRPDLFPNIKDYLPASSNGAFVFTSRHAEVERLGKSIEVRGMTQDEAVELFLQQARQDASHKNVMQAREIVQSLGCLPLALDQAGSYVSWQRLPLENFLGYYSQRKDVILNHTPSLWEYRKDSEEGKGTGPVTTFTTWEMSLEQIPKDDGLKAISYFLTISAFLDARDIEQSLFRKYVASLPQNASWTVPFITDNQWDEYKFQDLIAFLRGLSLIEAISFTNGNAHFSLHPLVSEWLRLRISPGEREKFAREASLIVTVSIEASYDHEIDFETRRTLVAHVDACILHKTEIVGGDKDLCSFSSEDSVHAFAAIYNSCGRFEDARSLYTWLLGCQKGRSKLSHSQTAMNLANVLRNLGKYDIAEQVAREVLEERIMHLGPSHVDTLRALEGLALTHCLQEKLDEATSEYMQILSSRETFLGVLDHETIRTVQCLANCLRLQSRYSEAEALYGRAVLDRAQLKDPPGVCTFCSLEGLAIVYRHQGRLNEAIYLYEMVMDYLRKTFGVHHPRFLHTTLNLSIAYVHVDKSAAAEYMATQAHEGFRDLFGPDHPDTQNAADQMAEAQLLKTSKYVHCLFHRGRQRAILELTEPRKKFGQEWGVKQKLTNAERSSLQERFFNDSDFVLQDGSRDTRKDQISQSSPSSAQASNPQIDGARRNQYTDQSRTLKIEGKAVLLNRIKKDRGLGPTIPSRDEAGRNRLRHAATGNDFHPSPKDYGSSESQIQLFESCGTNYGGCVDLLLHNFQLGPDVKDLAGNTQLSRATRSGFTDVVKYLLSRNDVFADSICHQGMTPLMHACSSGNENIMELLLARKDVNINARDQYEKTPLLYAASSEKVGAFKMLLGTNQVDINDEDREGETSLMWWARYGNAELVDLLLDLKVKHVQPTTPGWGSPLSQAVSRGYEGIVENILRKGSPDAGAINRAFSDAASRGNERILRLLLDTGVVDVNNRDEFSRTPLLCTVHGHRGENCRFLLEHGADPSVRDMEGQTTLLLASSYKCTTIVKFLLEHSEAEIDICDNKGNSPLFHAVTNGHEDVVQQLLNAGATINIHELEGGQKPKWVTAERREDILRLVLQAKKERD